MYSSQSVKSICLKLQNVFVWMLKHILLNFLMYFLIHQIYLSDHRTVFVQIAKCIRPNYKCICLDVEIYLSKSQEKYVPISKSICLHFKIYDYDSKNICTNFKLYLFEVQNIFVWIWKWYIFNFKTFKTCLSLRTTLSQLRWKFKMLLTLKFSEHLSFWASSSRGSGHSELQGWPGVKQQSWVRAACCGETDCDQRALWSGG